MKVRKGWRVLIVLAVAMATVALLLGLSVQLANPAIALVGIQVIFGLAFLVSIIIIIRIFVRSAHAVKNENDTVTANNHEIATVNKTSGYRNRMALAEHEVKSWLRTVRAAERGDLIKSVLLLVWLFGTLITGVVLLAHSDGGTNQVWLIAGLACIACFPLTIVIAMVAVVLRQRLSRRVDHNRPPLTATVVSCTVSSQDRMGQQTQRIGKTTYRMVVSVSGGEKLVAYTRRAYNAGDQVTVNPSRTRGLVTVVDDR